METSASWLDAGNIYSRVVLYGTLTAGLCLLVAGSQIYRREASNLTLGVILSPPDRPSDQSDKQDCHTGA